MYQIVPNAQNFLPISFFLVKITQGISQRDKQDEKTELHLMQAKH